MKMKQWMMVGLGTLLMVGFMGGCAAAPATGSSEPETSGPAADAAGQSEMIFGKVTAITGNEIELHVGRLPEETTGESTPEGTEGEMVPAQMTGPAQAVGDEGGAPSKPNGPELEYTDETITVRIPAGAEIQAGNGSGTKTISDIKTGSILGLKVDNDKDLNVLSAIVMG